MATERAGQVGPLMTCYCGRDIVNVGYWEHTDDGSRQCWPDEPRHSDLMAEPDPHQPAECEDVCMTKCIGACGVL